MSRKQEQTIGSWYSQESPGSNPDWFTLSNLFSSINWKVELKIILSNVLRHCQEWDSSIVIY